MKKILLLTGVLLALTATYASAVPGLDMSWGGCPLTTTNPSDMADPCDSNFNQYFFWMAFKAPAGISKLVAETFIVDVQTAAPVLPDWWHLEDRNDNVGVPAGCRGNDPIALRTGSFGYSTLRSGASIAVCKDYWGASPANGTTVWYPGTNGPDRTRLYGVWARGGASAGALIADVEYYVGSGSFDTNHAFLEPGVDVCGGCTLGACLVFNWLFLEQPVGTPNGDFTIESSNVRRYMTWQGGQGTICPAATSVRKATWGQVKSMYR